MDKILTIRLTEEDQQTCLFLSGRLDTLGARKLDETIQDLSGYPSLHLLLDMEKITFLSSAGIRILIKYYKLSRQADKKFSLNNVPLQAASTLKMVGLDQLLPDNEQPPVKSSPQESEYDGIRFLTCQLHQEPATLLHHTSSASPSSLHPYDLAVGRDQTDNEFIVWNNHFFSEQSTQVIPDYYIGTHGSPSHFITFNPMKGQAIPLSTLIINLLRVCEAQYAGIIIHAHTAGLIGLYTSSGKSGLTRFPLYTKHTTCIAGIVHTNHYPETEPFTRILHPGGILSGHLHAAVYPYIALSPNLTDPINQLDEFPQNAFLKKLLHLLYDNRPDEGSGESQVREGYAWIIKIK